MLIFVNFYQLKHQIFDREGCTTPVRIFHDVVSLIAIMKINTREIWRKFVEVLFQIILNNTATDAQFSAKAYNIVQAAEKGF